MKILKNIDLHDLDNKPIMGDGDKVWTLDRVCSIALRKCGVTPEGRPADFGTQSKRYKIARRIRDDENIDAEDIAEIRVCVGFLFASSGTDLAGTVDEHLNKLLLNKDG